MKVRDIVFFVMGVALIVGAIVTESLHYATFDHQRDELPSGTTRWNLLPEEDFTIGIGQCAFVAGSILCIFSIASIAYTKANHLRKKQI